MYNTENEQNYHAVQEAPFPSVAQPQQWGGAPQDAPNTFEARHFELIKKVKNGTGTLLLIFILSLVNVISAFAELSFSFPFGMFMPGTMMWLGGALGSYFGIVGLFSIASAVFGFLMLLGSFLMWIFSKKHTWAVTVFLVIFSIDTLFLAVIALLFPDNIFNMLVEFAFHAWALFAIIALLRNRMQLERLRRSEAACEVWQPYTHPAPGAIPGTADNNRENPWN